MLDELKRFASDKVELGVRPASDETNTAWAVSSIEVLTDDHDVLQFMREGVLAFV